MVDDHALEVADEEVADDPERQLRLLVDERRSLGALGAPLDGRPELLQESEVAFELFLRGALGRRADDEPAVGKLETLADDLEPFALLVLQAARDADAVPVRDEDEEPAGKRDLGRQPGALRSHGVLDRLDEHLLAALDQLLDAAPVARLPFELRDDDLVHVEEPVLLEPDLDEGRLHAREDVVDDALVDVARHGAVRGAAEVDLDDDAVLEHGDPLLGHLDRDEDLLLDLRKGRALRRLRAPAARLRVLPVLLLLPGLARLGLGFRRSLRLGLCTALGGFYLLLAAASAAAGPAAPARLGLVSLSVRLGRRGLLERFGSGRLGGRRLLAARLLAKQSHDVNLLSGARRHPRVSARARSACLPQSSFVVSAESRSPDLGSVLPARTR